MLPAIGDMVPGWGCGVSRNGGKLGDDVTSFLYLDTCCGMESRGECWEVAQCTQTLGFGHCPVNGRSTQGCELVHWLRRWGDSSFREGRMSGEAGVGGRVV